MIGYPQDLLETTEDYYLVAKKDDMTIGLLINSDFKIPVLRVLFGPTDNRGTSYISIYKPQYICQADNMMDFHYRDLFVDIIQKNWKNCPYLYNIMKTPPDYIKLRCQRFWKPFELDIDKGSLLRLMSTKPLVPIYYDSNIPMSIFINEYKDIYDRGPYFYIRFYRDDDIDEAFIDAINIYYITKDRLSPYEEEYVSDVLASMWEHISLDNKLLNSFPKYHFYDLAERSMTEEEWRNR